MIFLDAFIALVVVCILCVLLTDVIYPILTDRPLFFHFRKKHPTLRVEELTVALKTEKEKNHAEEIVRKIKTEKEQRNQNGK